MSVNVDKELVSDGVAVSEEKTVSEVTSEIAEVNVFVISVAEDVSAVVVTSDSVFEIVVVSGTRPPVSGETAYGGSKSPKLPHALQGDAQDLTGLGAARMGSQWPLGAAVAMTDSASVWGQLVPRSPRVNCCVIDPSGMMVETWSRSKGKTTLVPDGPARPAVL